ncbi:IS3 family transposase [Brevibacterium sp. SMBL_HHYL_HB1]|uniref:IS3 family transposase n=1 Tax=Brevibacterium sp. SMBL_HHYL_HB1 TaxID=2777556 RepID=UPI001BA6D46C|nr:IS3 family transposase [Brevibacterium sp. SMBL_HHYL_HB1]QUL80256.1 IS3 family transposase [Brevibacterium sp. SMBL_HHYL_HB1]
MPQPYPKEFRDDVVRVALNRDEKTTIAQIAKDFGVHEGTIAKWLRQADIDAGNKPGKSTDESAELRELRRRTRLLEQENEVLRRAAAYLAGESVVKRLYPLVRELAADGIPVAVSCRVLKLSRQPYYRWLAAPVPEAEVNEAYRANALFDAHRDDPEFGYRYLADEAEIAGEPMAVRTAWRLCSDNAWFSVFGKARANNGKKPGPPVHDDLCVVTDADGRVRHEFRATAVNELWLTDITEHRTDEGKLYMCAIKDVYSSRIVGYSIGVRMKARLAVDALEMAVARRGGDVAGCVVHSDRGSQFRSKKFTRALARRGIVGSMGRVGAAGDNAAMESFFALLQRNVLDRRRWASREQLRLAIVTWIERRYHRRRRQARLGRLTPVEYETIIESPAVAA